MTDDADKPDKPTDENENLVKALESIKSLLATSETKLSQARESISQASAHSLKMTKEVPVLDDIIVPGKTFDSTEGEISPTAGAGEAGGENQVELASFRSELEKEMRAKLAAYAAELEVELKAKIQAYFDKDPPKPG